MMPKEVWAELGEVLETLLVECELWCIFGIFTKHFTIELSAVSAQSSPRLIIRF